MTRYRLRWLLGASVLVAALVLALAPALAPDVAPARVGVTAMAGPPAAGAAAVDVLHAWDGERAVAYARGDAIALRALYVGGASAADQDLRMLRGYTRRGLKVEGIGMQLIEVEVLLEGPRRYRLKVTDRLVGAVAVGPSTRVRLPRDQASTRLIVLTRVSARAHWKVASVRNLSPSAPMQGAR